MKKFFFAVLFFALSISVANAQFIINNGTHVVISDTTKIVLNNLGWVQRGSMTPGKSTVIFKGTTASLIATDGNNPTFYKLLLDKPTTILGLADTISVQQEMVFSQGNLDLNGNLLNLGNTGKLTNEQENSRVISTTPNGQIIRTVDFTGAITTADSGQLGLAITTSRPLGPTQIIRSHDIQAFPGGSSIQRYFDIIPTNNSELDATLRFSYFDGELNSLSEGDLTLFNSPDNGINWNPMGTSNKDPNLNFLEQTGVPVLNRITASSIGNFPVEWLAFTAEATQNRQTLLSWVTGSELNNQGFFIERTYKDSPFDWEAIGFVEGAGTSSIPSIYEFVDPTPAEGENLYRLKQVDLDGVFDYSEIRAVYFEPRLAVSLYPNPTFETTWLDLELTEDQKITVMMFDGRGRQVHTSAYHMLAGRNKVAISVADLAEGIYSVRLQGDNLIVPLKLSVK